MAFQNLIIFAVLMAMSTTALPSEKGAKGENVTGVYSGTDLALWIGKWEVRDGIGGMAISDFFCQVVLVNPVEFYSVMSNRRAVFDEWLGELGDLSFTDAGGCIDRECMRLSMIQSVQMAEPTSDAEKSIRDLLLTELRRIRTSVVD